MLLLSIEMQKNYNNGLNINKKKLATEFEMKDLGSMHYFLGLEIWQSPEKIFLNQGKCAVEILKRFDMLECKSMNTPMEMNLKLLVDTSSELVDATLYRQIIGSLMYLTNTRPNICFAMNTLSQYLVELRRVHLVVAKHVMRYLKGTLDYGLCYIGDHDFKLYGYIDSDWAGSASDIKRTSGCCFSLGSAMTSWKSRKQSSMLRFGYLGKWSPCAYESLSTKGEDYYPCTLLYDSNFTLT
jgi:hypothetical protein